MSVRSDLPEIMDTTFCEVVEKVAFMFGDPVPLGDLDYPGAPLVHAAMSFDGPIQGSLALTVPLEMGTELAANALGSDPDESLSEEQAIDAINELLNVTCGQMVTALAGEKPAFDLTAPHAALVAGDLWEGFCHAPNTQGYSVEEYPVLLQLVLPE